MSIKIHLLIFCSALWVLSEFCMVLLSAIQRDMLKSSGLIVSLSISSLNSILFLLYAFGG